MFDYEKLIAYQRAKEAYTLLEQNIGTKALHRSIVDQVQRASLSMVLNIAEGTGKVARKDCRNFYAIARGSAYECASILDLIPCKQKAVVKEKLLEVSKLLSGLIVSLEK